jgi:hypothetical protein
VNLRPAVLVLAILGLAVPASAQLNQPIYPAYDGFLANPDGSYTLAFAYFSHNAETVTVAAGAQNSFSPSPLDRQQPITFKPGHWRFQCVMVVGPDFDGKLRWTLTYGGVTTGTSEHMLQSNWNLVEGAAELKQIDYAKVPKGVCLNRAPQVRVLGSSGAAAASRRRSPSTPRSVSASVVRQRQRRRAAAYRQAGRCMEAIERPAGRPFSRTPQRRGTACDVQRARGLRTGAHGDRW